MAENIKKISKAYLAKGLLSLTFLFVLICVALYVLSGNTLGWFTTNKSVTGTDMQVSIEEIDADVALAYKSDRNETEYTPVADVNYILAGMTPGDRRYIKATLTNREDTAFTVNAALELGREASVRVPGAFTDANGNPADGFLYLGSQLRVIWAGPDDTVPADSAAYAPLYLLGNPGASDNDPATPPTVCFDSQQTPPASLTVYPAAGGTSDITLPAAVDENTPGTVDVYIVIEFANFPVNQNGYALFGEGESGACSRLFAFSLSPIASANP